MMNNEIKRARFRIKVAHEMELAARLDGMTALADFMRERRRRFERDLLLTGRFGPLLRFLGIRPLGERGGLYFNKRGL